MSHRRGDVRTRRPVCKYGAGCLRKNPQHFIDFAHPGRGDDGGPRATMPPSAPPTHTTFHVPPASAPPSHVPAATAPPAPPVASLPRAPRVAPLSQSVAPVAGGRRCKFGCGRPVNQDKGRVYNTCCRRCAVCQGGGEHDEGCAGGASKRAVDKDVGPATSVGADPEAAALLAIDYGLELWRRAKHCESVGDAASARELLADSTEQLKGARSRLPAGSKLKQLCDSVLRAFQSAGNKDGERPLGTLEEEVDAELEQLVVELERILAVARDPGSVSPSTALAAICKYGCGRPVKTGRSGGRSFDTCCRTCARCSGAGSHDADCTGGSIASTSALVPATMEVGVTSDALEPGGSGPSGDSAGASDGPAVEALRALGLDDTWPTELTMREIRRRYMREALASHPDKGPAEEKSWRTNRFREVSEAYAALELHMAMLERGRDPSSVPSSSCDSPAGPAAAALEGGQLALEAGQPALGLGFAVATDRAPRKPVEVETTAPDPPHSGARSASGVPWPFASCLRVCRTSKT
mmetsp:Transcript_44753/g.97406  ORF Transcript_44753/g.97406 Transcript_44753/m.97406 type:complete len:524 (+) Transcript_44753:83-1654(+)